MAMLSIKSGVRIEQSDTKNILIDSQTGEFYECNDTAVFLIQKLFNKTSKEALVKALHDVYDITVADAQAQVEYCLTVLSAMGVLHEQA